MPINLLLGEHSSTGDPPWLFAGPPVKILVGLEPQRQMSSPPSRLTAASCLPWRSRQARPGSGRGLPGHKDLQEPACPLSLASAAASPVRLHSQSVPASCYAASVQDPYHGSNSRSLRQGLLCKHEGNQVVDIFVGQKRPKDCRHAEEESLHDKGLRVNDRLS